MNKIKSFFGNIGSKIRSVPFIDSSFTKIKNYFAEHPFKAHLKLSLILSFLVVMIVQGFECKSVFGGIVFIFGNTYFFIINYLIVLFTYAILFLFKKRMIWIWLITILWSVLGLANYIVMMYRAMPIAAIDFVVMTTTRDIIPHYFSVFHIILVIVLVLLAIALFVFLFIKAKKYERTPAKAIVPVICAGSLLSVFLIGGGVTGNLKISYSDVTGAYDEHGFIYCFSSSLFVRGIPKPDEYSLNDVEKIMKKYDDVKSEETKTPNIVVVQLESFMDPSKYTAHYPIVNDPIPNFHKICSEYGEGSLSVPSNGGGTVNTEFEILTGMNLEYFGTIEYPYTTILQDTTCESAAYILEEHNYTSHAIHNHTGVFYGRHKVYPNLGFDNFIPIEFMQFEKTETGWAKDTAILDNTIKAVESTPGKDFVFAVTVQGHGAYSSEHDPQNPFKVRGKELLSGSDIKKASMYEYYCGLLHETDKVIGDLYNYVMNSDEDFVVILYGDHLPSLEIDPELYDYKSGYMTTYTMFSNMDDFEYSFTDDMPSFRLMSSVFEVLGIDEGLINKINRNHDDPMYESELGEIQYDMLYGKGYSLNGKPYQPKPVSYGSSTVKISSVTYEDGFLTVRGENFNQKSEININGRERDTAYVDSNTVVCACSKISDDDIISVCQTAVEGTKLFEAFYQP